MFGTSISENPSSSKHHSCDYANSSIVQSIVAKNELARTTTIMFLEGNKISNKLSLSMVIKTLLASYLLTNLLVQDCFLRCDSQLSSSHLLNQQQQQQHHLLNAALQQHQQTTNSLRSMNLPNITLLSNTASGRPNGSIGAEDLQKQAASLEVVWPSMHSSGVSGTPDLSADEGKSVASFADNRNSTMKANKKSQSSNAKRKIQQQTIKNSTASNKTVYDDEQQPDSSESNEMFDDAEEGTGLAGIQKEPECASHGRYYCTYKEDYPLKLVTEVTKYYKWPLEKLFRDLHAQIMPKLAQDSTGNLVCDSVTRVVRPGWARNTNDRWLVVINTENYHQYVTEVVCQYGSNSRCNFIPPCYYSSCQQRYNTQKLLVIDPANPYRGPFLSEFLFPSCCVCYVPSASDSYHDKYRSTPATIYQRTMQQESANNVYPPQFSPAGLMPVDSSGQSMGEQVAGSSPRQAHGHSSSKQANSGSNTAPLPGEIRREGDQYSQQLEQLKGAIEINNEQKLQQQQQRVTGPNTLDDSFPRLGLTDTQGAKS